MSFLIVDGNGPINQGRMYHNGLLGLARRFERCHILFINLFRPISLGSEGVC